MTIETKFNVGDEVLFVCRGKLRTVLVTEVEFKQRVYYKIKLNFMESSIADEDELYASKADFVDRQNDLPTYK